MEREREKEKEREPVRGGGNRGRTLRQTGGLENSLDNLWTLRIARVSRWQPKVRD